MTLARLLALLLAGACLAAFGTPAEATSYSGSGDCAYVYPDPSVDPDECMTGGSGSGGGGPSTMMY